MKDKYGVWPSQSKRSAIDLQLRSWARLCRSIGMEFRTKTEMSWRQRWKALRAGFKPYSWEVYELDRNSPADYVQDWRAMARMYKVNGFANPIVGNKLVLSELLRARGIPHPRVISTIVRGRVIGHESLEILNSSSALKESFEQFPRQVFRPTWTGGGKGVFFVNWEPNSLRLDGEEISFAELCSMTSKMDDYLVTEFQDQHDYAKKIYPHTTNTMRILTLWDWEQGEPFVAAVTHRFGSSRSGLLDSFHRGWGGLCAEVGIDSGVIGQAIVRSEDGKIERVSHHPDSSEAIEGITIPGFAACIEGMIGAARAFASCPLIGWDVAMTPRGFTIIEANPLPSFVVTQASTPLLRDNRTRRVLQQMGLARR